MWTMSDVCGDHCGPVSYPMSVSVPSVGGGDGKRVGKSGSEYPHDSNMSQMGSGVVLHGAGFSGREHIARAAICYNGGLTFLSLLDRRPGQTDCEQQPSASLGFAVVLLAGKLEDTLARPLQPCDEQAGLDCNETASSRLQGEATP